MPPEQPNPHPQTGISNLIARGQCQTLQYMSAFPDDAGAIAQHIAAFATSNAGTILVGVNDDGTVTGLFDAPNDLRRKRLTNRIDTICVETVRPLIAPVTRWVVESGKVVLAISVSKGTEALYYAQGRPYLRNGTQSRLVAPHEAIEIVRRYLFFRRLDKGRNEDDEGYDRGAYMELRYIVDRLMEVTEIDWDTRWMGAWRDHWIEVAQEAIDPTQNLIEDPDVNFADVHELLLDLKLNLQKIVTSAADSKTNSDFIALTARVRFLVFVIKADYVDVLPADPLGPKILRKNVSSLPKSLRSLAEKIRHETTEAGLAELLRSTGAMGGRAMGLSFIQIPDQANQLLRLRAIGIQLRLLYFEFQPKAAMTLTRHIANKIEESERALIAFLADLPE